MPTAFEYRAAADHFRTTARLLRDSALTLDTRTDGWLGGPVADHHTDSVVRLRRHLVTAGDGFDHLASLAERRSIVCAGYAAALRQYERLELWVRLFTPSPERPATWAEV